MFVGVTYKSETSSKWHKTSSSLLIWSWSRARRTKASATWRPRILMERQTWNIKMFQSRSRAHFRTLTSLFAVLTPSWHLMGPITWSISSMAEWMPKWRMWIRSGEPNQSSPSTTYSSKRIVKSSIFRSRSPMITFCCGACRWGTRSTSSALWCIRDMRRKFKWTRPSLTIRCPGWCGWPTGPFFKSSCSKSSSRYQARVFAPLGRWKISTTPTSRWTCTANSRNKEKHTW